MIYIFTIKSGSDHSEFERSCRDDLSARKIAQANPTVIMVTTEGDRVVYRKPMSMGEMNQALKMPVHGDFAGWLDRRK